MTTLTSWMTQSAIFTSSSLVNASFIPYALFHNFGSQLILRCLSKIPLYSTTTATLNVLSGNHTFPGPSQNHNWQVKFC
jgi:hypothetical protein